MAANRETENYVKKAVKDWKYTYPDATKREVMEVIGHWKGLKPIVTDFVFGNGQNKKLIALQGTIPINYRGQYYHIPVEIFLLDTHPHNAPLAYVRPTANMRIKASRHVDNSGRVYLPFLHSWKPDSGLMALVQVLICTFEEQPPVYAVPADPVAQPMPTMGHQGNGGSMSTVPYPLSQSYSSPYPVSPYGGMPMPGAIPQMPSLPNQISSDTLTPDHMRASLLSAGGEKLRRRLEDVYFSTLIEIKTGDQLKEGTTALEAMMRHLEEEKTSLARTIAESQTEAEELDGKIQKETEEEGEVIVDEAIQPPAPLYKQIVNSFAEEAAIEDTIYYLSEGFRNGKLDWDQFQKHLRIMARKQFMLRAMLRKCRQKAGLAG